ncbi:MAG: hypothetical protein A3K19_03350 [Lentisphaerae bacterium RIFOXYB12_FULL_65_16]|nr:MAG: hypothetical protein A3K18_33145 [Lentisphaerae bacterium RIFOXYA12_64_32]OGV92219.1 MAG: hypothetical protein A3K19_03350 [Lentisphaerae bacterium RIFOXYB12_FULL_65_16]
MEKHRTRPRTVRLSFIGPPSRRTEAVRRLEPLGFVEAPAAEEQTVPWRAAFPEYTDAALPGVTLAGLLARDGITQVELSERTGIPQPHISAMAAGKRPIGKATACKLAAVFNVSYRLFL